MSSLVRDIQRLLEKHKELSVRKLVFDASMSEMELLEFREILELEVSTLTLQNDLYRQENSIEKNGRKTKKKNISHESKQKLSRAERLCRKFFANPHAFFADSRYFVVRIISLFIKKGQ